MKSKTVIVTGLHGYIGSVFAKKSGKLFSIIDINRSGIRFDSPNVIKSEKGDITSKKDIERIIGNNEAEFIIHLAAKTHINGCEADRNKKEKGETWRVNVIGTQNIAQICKKYSKKLIYLSTECVFDGKSGKYKEDDTRRPVNWYGMTKKIGEDKIMESDDNFIILRSVLAYGHTGIYPHDLVRNIILMMEKKIPIKAVDNQNVSFTYIDDLADALVRLINSNSKGVYHYAGDRILTPYTLALKIKDVFGFAEGKIIPVTINEYFGKRSRLRLKNATLVSDKIKNMLDLPGSDVNKALVILKKKLDKQ